MGCSTGRGTGSAKLTQATAQELELSGCCCPSERGTFCCVEGLAAAILAGTTSLVTKISVTPASPTGPTMV